MARARNIKPSFFRNEGLAELGPFARLLFIGLWTLADRNGRLEDRPRRIRVEILPYDECDTDTMLDGLHQAGFIKRYVVDEERYIEIVNFCKHQNPHCKEPAGEIPAPCEHGTGTVLAQCEHGASRADSLNLIPDSLNLAPQERGEVFGERGIPPVDPPLSRRGSVCGLLRQSGMADAAPSYLTDETWDAILALRTDAEIVEVATAKMAANPGRRIGLKYLAPVLLEPPTSLPRGSPRQGAYRKTASEVHAETLAGLTGRKVYTPNTRIENDKVIDGIAERLAS